MESKTPKTDEKTYAPDAGDFAFVDASFARELETELAEAQKHLSAIMAVLPDDAKPCDAPHLILHFKKQMGAYGGEFIRVEKQLAEARAEVERLKDSICYANKTNQSCDFPKLQEQQKLIEQMRNAIKGALRSADAEWESKNQGHDWAEACKTMRTALEAAKGASE